MEVVAGALPSVLYKLGELLVDEYNLQTEVRGGIKFLRSELESMQVALEKISDTPIDQLDKQDRIWARDVRELSYDIEDNIDTFIVRIKGDELATANHGFKKLIDKALNSLMKPKIRGNRKIATNIRDIKCRVEEVAQRRDRCRIDNNAAANNKPFKVDPRTFIQYEKSSELVGIEEARDEVIKILTQGNEVSKKQDKIVSIVGFGGLGKTTLASVVYEKLKEQFDYRAFVSVSQTPDMEKMSKEMVRQLTKKSNENINGLDDLKEFLQNKRYERIA
jgi:ATPase subunit of ABC transporter with duplicated ATPase domains